MLELELEEQFTLVMVSIRSRMILADEVNVSTFLKPYEHALVLRGDAIFRATKYRL